MSTKGEVQNEPDKYSLCGTEWTMQSKSYDNHYCVVWAYLLKYGYLPISLIGRMANLKVSKYDFRKQKAKHLTIAEPKGTNCLFRNSNIIPDVGLTNFPLWESIVFLSTNLVFEIMGIWLPKFVEWPDCHFGNVLVSCDFGSNRFRKSRKCCPMWTTLYIMYIRNHFL